MSIRERIVEALPCKILTDKDAGRVADRILAIVREGLPKRYSREDEKTSYFARPYNEAIDDVIAKLEEK